MKKSKVPENRINYLIRLSPNFSPRKNRIKFIILHYTGMIDFKSCLQRFDSPASKVSAHWLISRNGKLYKIVDENNIAWHAGKSKWKENNNLNKTSIGIELDNPGHGRNYDFYPKKQMNILKKLIKNICLKYSVKKENILGHSDIAPDRKADPGEFFSWEELARSNLAFFPDIKSVKNNKILLTLGDKSKNVLLVKKELKKIGYSCDNTTKYDLYMKSIVEAFQRRFLPAEINGIVDSKVFSRIYQISKKT